MIIKCNKCKQDKECELFSKRSKSKTGYNDWCKICQKEYNTQYYINNKHIIDEYKNKNKDKINQYNEQYRKSYYQNNKNHILDISKQYYELNKEQLLEKQKVISKRHYQNNKEHHKQYQIIYKQLNPEYYKHYFNKRYNNDIRYKLKYILRSRFNSIFKIQKHISIIKLIGCSLNEYKQYLEQLFKPEMNWDNYGSVWEIDHIKPCSSFDLIQLEEQQKCFHYLNTQPLFKTTAIAELYGYIDQIGNRNKGCN